MDLKSLEMLEFPQIRQIIAGFTSFSASRELALALEPVADYQQASTLLKRASEARSLLFLDPSFGIGGVHDVRQPASMAVIGKVLEPQTLVEVQQTLGSLGQLRSRLSQLSTDVPLIWGLAEGIADLHSLAKDIERCIAPTGEIFDSASPRLATIRQELKKVRDGLLEHLQGIVNSPTRHRIIQEPIITERDGRYVIPVKVEYRKDIKGIVHDVSNTGATVFIEPWATIEAGNTLRELVLEERHEIEKVLAGLSAQVGTHEAEISRSVALAAEIDLALAKARYARKNRAAEPVLVSFDHADDKTVLKLIEARHPLLGDKAVPLSVEIGREFSALVITGPNTGGKTVALKTIGLLSLMARAGLPIPAAPESQIPLFDSVFADIGDEQSIEQTLSTFSWHVGNINRIINHATAKSLVLLDELGTSTDPAEGSALARAMLLYFLSHGNMTVATTHFSDLKAFAHVTPGMQNASLDFDPVTLAPTYHLLVGIPGGSNALATAARLGLPAEIVERARGMLTKGTEELESLLASLMSERQAIEAMRRDAEKERRELEERNVELKKELQRLKAEERAAVQETRDRVVREAAELHKEIRQALSDLRKEEKSRARIEEAKKALAAVQDQLKKDAWKVPAAETEDSERIKTGDQVLIRDANVTATVLSVSEETQEVEVEAGQTRLRLSLDSVGKVAGGVVQTTPAFHPTTLTPKRATPMELDLRGKRADEVEPMLDSYLNDAVLASLSEARIIHGYGTGTVRRIVRDFLAGHTLVKSFRSGGPKEGGDGVTVVSL